MLERIRELFELYGDRESFFSVIGSYYPPGSDAYQLIAKAYDSGKATFQHVKREGGDRYFEHLRGVTLIILIHLRIRDPNVIAAGLLHDSVEDFKEWTRERVALEFNQKISELVWWVSKPDVVDYDGNEEARNRAYHANLQNAPREAVIVKLADRLHNLLTQGDTPKPKRIRKVAETRDFYLPLAEKEIVLIHEIEAAIDRVLAGLEK